MAMQPGSETCRLSYEHAAGAFRHDRSLQSDGGKGAVERDIDRVSGLAKSLVGSLVIWAPQIMALETHNGPSINTRRAAALVLESLFDDVLDGPSWRLLAAAVDRDLTAA